MIKQVWFHKLCDKLYRDLPTNTGDNFKNWLYENSLSNKICEECNDLHAHIMEEKPYDSLGDNYDDISPVTVERCWHEIFTHICYYLGINSKSVEVLWANLGRENWTHLHQTEDEKQRTEKEWFDAFYHDMLYCSDRWSLTRLERCHWAFRQWYKIAVEKLWFSTYVKTHDPLF